MTRLFLPALLGASAIVLTACGGETTHTTPDAKSVYEVDGAYIMAPLGGRDMTGGGLTVKVTGPDATFVSAASPSAETVELHTMEMVDGVMKMRKVDGLPVSVDTPLVLEPGGAHLMLFGVEEGVQAGDKIELLLEFENVDGEIETLSVETDVKGR